MSWLSDQTRLLALVTGQSYEAFMRANCIRWRVPWRDELGALMDDKPEGSANRQRATVQPQSVAASYNGTKTTAGASVGRANGRAVA